MNEFEPDWASPPGDTLKDFLEEYGLNQSQLAELMGRPKKTINEIIKGKAAITPETALQLACIFPISAQFWLNRESQYRLTLARLAAGWKRT